MDKNFSKFGFTLQKCICDQYKIVPNNETAISFFASCFDNKFETDCSKLIKKIFSSIKLQPVSCTTFDKSNKGKCVSYNFILEDNSSLSIRTNLKGYKIAPRNIGQAGYKKLNEYFGKIYGILSCS